MAVVILTIGIEVSRMINPDAHEKVKTDDWEKGCAFTFLYAFIFDVLFLINI